LNCKMQKELELLAQINAKWSCHFDDDNYVNIDQLLQTLAKYDHNQSFYIGRSSIEKPVRIGSEEFWFATGGAGICLSRQLLHKIYPYIARFERLSPGFGFVAPDDVSLGFLITSILNVPLTSDASFNSHLNYLTSKQLQELHKQSTLGPRSSMLWRLNPLNDKDEQLFYALHCHNFPHKCRKMHDRLKNR